MPTSETDALTENELFELANLIDFWMGTPTQVWEIDTAGYWWKILNTGKTK
ncbi:MAG: hypothetical protein WAK48_03810 [Candidatus Acidiferrum sp.]